MKESIWSLLDGYLQYQLAMEIYDMTSADAVRSDFRGLLRFMEQHGIETTTEAFTPRVVAKYLAANHQWVAGSTLRPWFKSCHGFGRWAENNEYFRRNPVAKVELGWVPTHRREFSATAADVALEPGQPSMTDPGLDRLVAEAGGLLSALMPQVVAGEPWMRGAI